jgi:hypothetical protein
VADDDELVTRRDLERALRGVHAAIANDRDDLLRLAAQVVALGQELARRMGDGLGDAVALATAERTQDVLAADEHTRERVQLQRFGDKYQAEPADVPCMELLPICQARCCKLSFPLSTQDLDEGVIRWDYGEPYLIRQRETDGYCVHNDAGRCSVHAQRPMICRTYTCKDDKRIWADFDNRVLAAPIEQLPLPGDPPDEDFDLHGRAQRRQMALMMEAASLRRR